MIDIILGSLIFYPVRTIRIHVREYLLQVYNPNRYSGHDCIYTVWKNISANQYVL